MGRAHFSPAVCSALFVALTVAILVPSTVQAAESQTTNYNPLDAFLSMVRESQTVAPRETGDEASPSRVFLPFFMPPPVPPPPQNVYHKHVHHLPKNFPAHNLPGYPHHHHHHPSHGPHPPHHPPHHPPSHPPSHPHHPHPHPSYPYPRTERSYY
ncbi:transmembrane protein [Cystoisospora suis]|uniref:Transmembrane protein n=1 Tax=Cystoisospora suis TaxID=483139 RepID=A0A2C6L151_9APIC|nr:transmembrane protein [Cystoisospora suis]